MSGRKATKQELKAWRATLQVWRTPAELKAVWYDVAGTMDTYAMSQPGTTNLREAFLAAELGSLVEADRARLGIDPPDFELEVRGHRLSFEAVEVQAPGRRRNDELAAERLLTDEGRPTLRFAGEDDWTPAAGVLDQLTIEVSKKAAKTNPGNTILAVFLNPGRFVEDYAVLASGIEGAVAPAFPIFAEVWVLRSSGELHFITPGLETSRWCPATPPPPGGDGR